MTIHIVSLYASVLALLFIGLSVRVVRLRRRLRIAIGDKGNQTMLRAMRVHSNFAEYAPLSLLLIYFVEASGAQSLFVHFLGLSLLVGRVSHAFGASQVKENFKLRVYGMVMTFTTLFVSAAYLLYLYASSVVT